MGKLDRRCELTNPRPWAGRGPQALALLVHRHTSPSPACTAPSSLTNASLPPAVAHRSPPSPPFSNLSQTVWIWRAGLAAADTIAVGPWPASMALAPGQQRACPGPSSRAIGLMGLLCPLACECVPLPGGGSCSRAWASSVSCDPGDSRTPRSRHRPCPWWPAFSHK